MCCGNGKVEMPDSRIVRSVPKELEELFVSQSSEAKNFREYIRNYNSALAFASIDAKVDHSFAGRRGPIPYKVSGDVRFMTSHLMSTDRPAYACLYYVDSQQALEERMGRSENDKCLATVMSKLDTVLRRSNVYAQAYKMIKDVVAQVGEPEIVKLMFFKDPEKDKRRYNGPSANEVAIVFTGESGNPPQNIDFTVFHNQHGLLKYSNMSPHIDPMAFPLLFPRGELGWDPNMTHTGRRQTASHNRLTMQQFYKYRLMERDNHGFTPLHHGCKLFQQYLVLSYVRYESNNLFYIRQNQSKLRIEKYQGLMDALAQDAADHQRPIGRVCILPSTFHGGPRYMQQNYQDAMAIVNRYGKPDLFITFTCNPNWPEITNELKPGQTPQDRPDLVARVFHLKLEVLLGMLKDGHFGRCLALIYVVEWQKRGLPHAHILMMLKSDDKIRGREMIDEVVCAEIPDETAEPNLYSIVTQHMIHGPCGELNRDCVCMEHGKCRKEFPKKFNPETQENVDGYPLYRRRDGNSFMKNGVRIDNRWVVPYNKFLLKEFNAHINVEICATVKATKYLYKYVYKGHDCAKMEITSENNEHDEITRYIDGRMVTAPEAAWRLLGFKLHSQSHHIERLAVHLPHQQNVTFLEGQERQVLENASSKDTTLTAYCKLCQSDPDARELLYTEVGESYRFVNGKWQKRVRRLDTISRMYSVSPLDRERYFLRLLLLNVRGPTSFENLRTVNGITCGTFEETARARGLLENDEEWSRCLEEASRYQSAKSLRDLFAIILVFCNPQNPTPVELFDRHLESLSEDLRRDHSADVSKDRCLAEINDILRLHGTKNSDFGLPDPVFRVDQDESYDQEEEKRLGEECYAKCNREQRHVVDSILQACEGRGDNKLFSIDGPGGTGKTYVYNTLMHILRGDGKIVIPVASTGIAATLLRGGRTAHSRFKLPVPLNETSTSLLTQGQKAYRELEAASLIIWDEVAMAQGRALEVLDLLLRDMMKSKIPFGGKIILLGGDFRQCLPVVPRGGRAAIVGESLKRCNLFYSFKEFKLTQNMRADRNEKVFAEWLLKLGEARLPHAEVFGDDSFQIPEPCVAKKDLVELIFGNDLDPSSCESFKNVAILTPRNEDSLEMNDKIVDKIRGEAKIYSSIDNIECDDPEEQNNYPMEFINSQTPSGMPPHILRLKIGSIVMLQRNLNTMKGLCNGTRLIIRNMGEHILDAEILTGDHAGERVFIPRINLSPSQAELPFRLRRRQFPIRLSFVMTINKSQGQTFDKIGLYLPAPAFGHGQIYVAFSRVRRFEDVKVFVADSVNQGRIGSQVWTQNVVYREVL